MKTFQTLSTINFLHKRISQLGLKSFEKAEYYSTTVISYSDYYPFGMLMPNRHGQDDDFRYGFNGHEKDGEIHSESYDFGARMLDARIGRWLSGDPQEANYPAISTYAFALNSPLMFKDPNGEDAVVTVQKNENGGGKIIISSTIYITGKGASAKKAQILNSQVSSVLKTKTFEKNGEKWSVEFDVKYEYKKNTEGLKLKNSENILEGSYEVSRAHVSRGKQERTVTDYSDNEKETKFTIESHETTGQKGKLSSVTMGSYNKKKQYTTFHETLHFLGLSDRYSDKVNPNDGSVKSIPHKGFENDIMGSRWGSDGKSPSKLSDIHYMNYIDNFSELDNGEYHLNHYVDQQTTVSTTSVDKTVKPSTIKESSTTKKTIPNQNTESNEN